MSGKLRWAAALTLLLCRPGQATDPEYPIAIAVAPGERVYVADRKLPGIVILKDGKFAPYFAGQKKLGTPLNAVRSLAVDRKGKLLAGDSATREVYRFDEGGRPVPLTNGGIGIPMSIAVLEGGDLVVADLELHRIWKVPEDGGKPEALADVPAPRAICVDDDNRIWVLSHGKDQLLRLDASGRERNVILAGRPFEFPSAMVIDEQGTAHVCDTYAKAIWRIAPGKKPEKRSPTTELKRPVALGIAGQELLIVDPQLRDVVRMNLND